MEVTVSRHPERRCYELAGADGTLIGRLDYNESDGVSTMWHTEVDPAFGGRGYGAVLVKGALDDARSRGLTVRPTCPFVARYIERHPEYADLLSS